MILQLIISFIATKTDKQLPVDQLAIEAVCRESKPLLLCTNSVLYNDIMILQQTYILHLNNHVTAYK